MILYHVKIFFYWLQRHRFYAFESDDYVFSKTQTFDKIFRIFENITYYLTLDKTLKCNFIPGKRRVIQHEKMQSPEVDLKITKQIKKRHLQYP